jgi:hypothetical protein
MELTYLNISSHEKEYFYLFIARILTAAPGHGNIM